MTTLADMRTTVASELGLDDSTGGDRTRITGWLNRGVVDVLARTHCYVTSSTSLVAFVAGQSDYTLDTGILAIVGLRTAAGPLERVGVDDIALMRAGDSQTGGPAGVYALAGANLLMVHPTPSAAETVTVYYVPRPTALSVSSDDAASASLGGIPTEYHEAVELYAMWKAGSFDDDQSSGQGERYRTLYEGQDGMGGLIARMKYELKRKGHPRRPPFRLAIRRQRLPAANDYDWRRV